MQKACVGFVRFSSEIQLKGSSIRRQRTLIDDYLKRNPESRLVRIYTDEGKSAYHNEHVTSGQFGQMVEDMKQGRLPKPCYLLVEDVTRLSRRTFDEAEQQLFDLVKMGFIVHTLADGQIFTPEMLSDLSARITFMVKAQAAHQTSLDKAHHSRKNWKQKREDAALTGKVMTKSCPGWLTPVATGTGENGTSFALNAHVNTVKRVFAMRLAGDSMNTIAFTMNSEGVPTLSGRGKGWNQSSVHTLLNNVAVIGDKVPSVNTIVDGVEIIHGYYPAIISQADYMTVQAMRSGKGRVSDNDNPTNINLFKGVLRCLCGGSIISASVTPERYGYYVCSMYRLKRCTCVKNYDNLGQGKGKRGAGNAIQRQLVDDALVKGVLYNLPLLLSGSNSDQKVLQQLEAERDVIIGELETIEDNMSRIRASERMLKRYEEKQDELDAKERQIDDHRSRMVTAVNVETVEGLDLSQRAPRIELNLIVKKYIKEITLNIQNKTCDIHFHNGYSFYKYPLWRENFDGASWVHLFLQLGEREYTFTGTEDITSGLPGRVQEYQQVTGKGEDGQKWYDASWPETEPDYPNSDK